MRCFWSVRRLRVPRPIAIAQHISAAIRARDVHAVVCLYYCTFVRCPLLFLFHIVIDDVCSIRACHPPFRIDLIDYWLINCIVVFVRSFVHLLACLLDYLIVCSWRRLRFVFRSSLILLLLLAS